MLKKMFPSDESIGVTLFAGGFVGGLTFLLTRSAPQAVAAMVGMILLVAALNLATWEIFQRGRRR